MLYDKFILKLLDLQEVLITDIKETANCFLVYCSSIKDIPSGIPYTRLSYSQNQVRKI